jgi:hypothetical protein
MSDTETTEAPALTEYDLRREVTYSLLIPIVRRIRNVHQEVREEEVTEVVVQRPKGKHLKAAARFKNEDEADMSLVGPLTGLTDKDVDELDALDLLAIGHIIRGFVQPGRGTGATT